MSGKARDPGTIADVIEARAPAQAPAAAIEPVDDLGSIWGAARTVARSDRTDFKEGLLDQGFEPILDALNAGKPISEQLRNPSAWGGNPDDLNSAGIRNFTTYRTITDPTTLLPWSQPEQVSQAEQMRRIFAEVQRRRAKDPGFLPGVPDNWPAYYRQLIDQEKATRAQAQSTLSRSSGFTAGATAFLGGATELITDPVNVATIPFGLGELNAAKSLGTIALREALLNGTLEAIQQPIVAENRAVLGEELTAGEAATNIGVAAAFGGAIPIVGRGVGRAGVAYDWTVGRVFAAMPETVQRKWADRMKVDGQPIEEFYSSLSHKDAAEWARDVIGSDKLSPDERAAIGGLEAADLDASSSPFESAPAGDTEHAGRLSEAMAQLIENRRAPEPAAATAVRAGGGSDALARPPAGSSPVARPQAPVQGNAAIATFKAKVRRAESGLDDRGDNPRSSAQGRYQFTDDTFVRYYRKVFGTGLNQRQILARKFDAGVQERLMDALTGDNAAELQRGGQAVTPGNLYLAHFLGPSAALKVLRADPSRAVSELLPKSFISANPAVLGGKSASEVAAWASRKMGGSAASVPAGTAGALAPATGGDDAVVAQLRGEALRLGELAIGETPIGGGAVLPAMRSARVDAGSVLVDAERFQFKAGGDEFGVTDRLRGVTEWNPIFAGRIAVWEDEAGQLFVADGHQRAGLARRIATASGQPIELDAIVMRAADGVTAEDARTWAALKNIAEGTGSATDVAKVIRQVGAEVLDRLPPRSALARDGGALARLSDEAFGAVYNDVIAPDIAAVVGHLAADTPDTHAGLVELLVRLDPPNRGQAESIVRQAIAAGFHKSEQLELFGAREMTTSLFTERAKVLERGLGELRKLKSVFGVASRNADTLEAAGSSIARGQTTEEAARNGQAIEIVSRLAFSKGSAVAEALNAAAAELAAGGRLTDVTARFVARVRELDLGSLERAVAGDSGRLAPDGAGRGGDAGEAGDAIPAERADQGQPSLLELETATKRFTDPDGPAAREQADSLAHDALLDLPELPDGLTFRFDDDGPERGGVDLLAELAEDEAAIAAIRGCL